LIYLLLSWVRYFLFRKLHKASLLFLILFDLVFWFAFTEGLVGYLPINEEEAKLFFQLIDKRYEKKSTIFTTSSNFKSWTEIFQVPKIANAILDRILILHHASVINIIGDSYRLKNHIQKDDKSEVQ